MREFGVMVGGSRSWFSNMSITAKTKKISITWANHSDFAHPGSN